MSFSQRFDSYFKKDVAQEAAGPLKDGVQIEFNVGDEAFTFQRQGGSNQVSSGTAASPEMRFTLTPKAAERILDHDSGDIGEIGVNIAKLIVSKDAEEQVKMELNAGFLTLWNKGYFGVIKKGGSSFASFMASKGLGGMGAIKAALKKMKG